MATVVLLLLDVARRMFRVSRLFAPDREPVISWDPEAYGVPAGRTQELWFETEDGEVLHGWYCQADEPIGSALYLHGNTGNLTLTATAIPHLLRSGLNVLMFDYRGFGKSSGRPSLNGIIRDGLDAARLHDSLRPSHLPAILYGFSMGGAVAAQMLHRRSFDGLILQSTFTTLRDIARVAYPRLPLHLLSGGFLDTARVIRELRLPVLFLHGSHDEVCPSWMGQALHDLCPSPSRRMLMVEGGLHKDLFDREPEPMVRTIREFVSGLIGNGPIREVPSGPLETLVNRSLRSLRRLFRSGQTGGNAVIRSAPFAAFPGPFPPQNSDRPTPD